jgi:hypothetical protein
MSFKSLDPEDFLVSADFINTPAWSNYSASISSFPTSNAQIGGSSGDYYVNVYNIDPDTPGNTNAEVQFSVAYGDSKGSGSLLYNSSVNGLSPTRTIYGQFVNLLLGEDENASFNFGGTATNENFYAIVINRARYKQAILPGSIQIGGIAAGAGTIRLTDNSSITPVVDYTSAGRRFTLGSGSFGNGVIPSSLTTGVYGYVYPDVGVIILNPASLNFITQRDSNQDDNNPTALISALSGDPFFLQSQETVTSDFVFVRARNAEFNYSINPSFAVSSSAGTILYDDFIQNPTTYISSVGMYNDNNELLAVAKLSKPLKKDFTKEALIRVKLDF